MQILKINKCTFTTAFAKVGILVDQQTTSAAKHHENALNTAVSQVSSVLLLHGVPFQNANDNH